MRVSRLLVTLAVAFVVCSALALAQSHVTQAPAEAKWGPAPPALPPGAEMAVLSGDPGKPAPYSVRVKFPANYAIPAHSHPTDENIVVASGTLFIAMGDKLDKAAGKGLAVGSYALMWTPTEDSEGPVGYTREDGVLAEDGVPEVLALAAGSFCRCSTMSAGDATTKRPRPGKSKFKRERGDSHDPAQGCRSDRPDRAHDLEDSTRLWGPDQGGVAGGGISL